jgi:hypothetical protein
MLYCSHYFNNKELRIRVYMYTITACDFVCVYCMVLTLYMVLCQLKKSNMVYDVVGNVGRISGLRRIYISVIP